MATNDFSSFYSTVKDLEPWQKGRKFEEAIVQWLSKHPDWRDLVDRVFMREEDPHRLFEEDYGVDLVVYLKDGRIGAVQAKCYQENSVLTLNTDHLGNWFAASGHRDISFRILIASASGIGKHVQTVIDKDAKDTYVYLYQDLIDAGVDWIDNGEGLELAAREPMKPRQHQLEAQEAVISHYQKGNDRALITPFCGTGKTKTAWIIWEALLDSGLLPKGQRPIFLFDAPLLALCDQQLKSFKQEIGVFHETLVVASDHKLGDNSTEYLNKFDFGNTIVTTDPMAIREQLVKNTDVPLFIMACQDSLPRIAEAQSFGGSCISFIVHDEAHELVRCVVPDSETSCALLLKHSRPLKSLYQLSMTATPKVLTKELRDLASERGAIPLSQKDETVFGKEVFTLSAKAAREQGLIAPYSLYAAGVTGKEVFTDIVSHEIISDRNLDCEDAFKVSSMIALIKLLKKISEEKKGFGATKKAMCLLVGNTLEAIDNYLELLRNINLSLNETDRLENLITLSINGNHNQRQRRQILDHYKKEDATVVVGHVRTVGVGIDCPSIDVVAFADPASEEPRVIQNVGRALRLDSDNPNKKARIFVPVFCPPGESVEEMSANGRFSSVVSVMCHLYDHDGAWEVFVNESVIQGRKLRRQPRNTTPKFEILECDIPKWVNLDSFIDQINLATITKLEGSLWSTIFEAFDWHRSQLRKGVSDTTPTRISDNEFEVQLAEKLQYLKRCLRNPKYSPIYKKLEESDLPESYYVHRDIVSSNSAQAIISFIDANGRRPSLHSKDLNEKKLASYYTNAKLSFANGILNDTAQEIVRAGREDCFSVEYNNLLVMAKQDAKQAMDFFLKNDYWPNVRNENSEIKAMAVKYDHAARQFSKGSVGNYASAMAELCVENGFESDYWFTTRETKSFKNKQLTITQTKTFEIIKMIKEETGNWLARNRKNPGQYENEAVSLDNARAAKKRGSTSVLIQLMDAQYGDSWWNGLKRGGAAHR